MRRPAVAANIGLALLATLVALGLIEAGFRVYQRMHPPQGQGFFWTRNPDYGWGLTPHREGVSVDAYGGEFRVGIRINSLGLHDVEHRYAKDPGTFRVLVLGDSYVEAMQVELGQSFGRVLERALRDRLGPRVEVVSAGVSSWGTDNELLYFRHEGYRYQPDLVLLVFTTTNDVRENYEPYNRLDAWANLSKPSFVLSDTGVLQERAGPKPPPLPWWRRLYVGDFVFRRLGGKVVLPRRGQNSAPARVDPAAPRVPADMLVHAPQYSADVTEAWRVTEALIRAVRDEAATHGAKFAVVVHGGPWVHYPGRWRLMFAGAGIQAARTWDRRKPSRLLDDFLVREDIPFVDLFDVFESAKRSERVFYRVNVHWTPAGNRVAAETAAQFLVGRQLVR